ncbi:pyridoxamine 5'-phosphate oxidase family protein [Deinococcus malanensis]|uniref:pyridoxamine 5'-phosphate oxidase family protein n=1 Tax=Deinococcus malanensis TaxID=1706855 RepID=UPI003625575F
MAKQLPALSDHLRKFIEQQHIFFVGTAAPEGRVNVSPKGMDSLRVLTPNQLAWLNVTGSGNETAAHLLRSSRMTLMFCSFDGPPLILRLYGRARMVEPGSEAWPALVFLFPRCPAHARSMSWI